MLKITTTHGGESTVVKLEGKLLAAWLDELSGSCLAACREGRLRLDLSSLSYADEAGATLLRDLLKRGATVASCSTFVAELLRESRVENRP